MAQPGPCAVPTLSITVTPMAAKIKSINVHCLLLCAGDDLHLFHVVPRPSVYMTTGADDLPLVVEEHNPAQEHKNARALLLHPRTLLQL